MDPNQHQGHYGESFFRVLAAAAGLTVAQPYPDVTGEDLTVGYKGRLRDRKHPKIDIQVKSWRRSNASWRDGAWKYRMDASHFNDLADTDFALPRYLVLVIVPDKPEDYACCREGDLVLSHAAYWVNLQGRPQVDPAVQAKVAVDVPRENLLTTQSLLALLERDDVDEEDRP